MKYKINKFNICLLIMVVIGLSSGCTGNQKQLSDKNKDLSISQVRTNTAINQSVANQAKEKVITEKEISDVKAINTDKELLVGVKVDQFNRFRLKKIKQKVKSKIEKMYPDYKVFVSTDQKIYLELNQLEEKLQKGKANKKSLKKEFNKIKSLMKEQS